MNPAEKNIYLVAFKFNISRSSALEDVRRALTSTTRKRFQRVALSGSRMCASLLTWPCLRRKQKKNCHNDFAAIVASLCCCMLTKEVVLLTIYSITFRFRRNPMLLDVDSQLEGGVQITSSSPEPLEVQPLLSMILHVCLRTIADLQGCVNCKSFWLI